MNVYMVDTRQEWSKLQEYVVNGGHEYISLDVETDSVSEIKANLYGIGISFTDSEAFYIPWRKQNSTRWWTDSQEKEIVSLLHRWCGAYKLIGWNLLYDTLVLEYTTGLNFSDLIYSDAQLLKHTVDEDRPFSLKECAVKYLGPWADKAQQAMIESVKANGGSVTKDNFEMYKSDTEILGEYCGWDTLLSRKMFDLLEPRLKEEGLWDLFYKEETMPLYREVTIPMKRRGFPIDVEYFKTLKTDITREINGIEKEIQALIEVDVKPFVDELLDLNYPFNKKGSFPKYVAKFYGSPLPIGPKGVPSIAKNVIDKAHILNPTDPFLRWMKDEIVLPEAISRTIQINWLKEDQERNYVFNLKSNDHLGWLLFEEYGLEPKSKTETGKPQVDDEYLESIKGQHPFVAKLLDHKKLNKLLSTYIDGILERQIDGIVYASMLQWGTTSGRYSSTNPNLQNLPREKDDDSGLSPMILHYVNAIKKGFVARKGRKLVNADYSALEPRVFAHVSGDTRLQKVFVSGEDLYSRIAIDVFGLTDCSANPKEPNYLKKLHPEKRQAVKVFALAVVYGAEAGRISKAMDVDYQEAQFIIEAYLDAYPDLKKYMKECDNTFFSKGIARTELGRVRHLKTAQDVYKRYGKNILDKKWAKRNDMDDIWYIVKNARNLSKNHPIQGMAGHIVNRSSIRANRLFRQYDIDCVIIMNVHDELCCDAREDQAEMARQLLKEAMENTVKISIPLLAEPKIASNWMEAK